MTRFFNTAGPSVAADHYTLDPLARFDLAEVLTLIAQQRYFVLHAPRQTGKTTALLALMEQLNNSGGYRAVYLNVEGAQAARNDVASGIKGITSELAAMLGIYLQEYAFEQNLRTDWQAHGPQNMLAYQLRTWAAADLSRPAILLIDEIDALVGDTLIAVLRQIRAGYAQRPRAFPQTVLLCGVRDVRDYRIHTSHQEIITGGSAFNIKTESLRLGNFSQPDIAELYGQYTSETGQGLAEGVLDYVWELTRGQPWLVNALARQVVEKQKPPKDRPLAVEDFTQAKEALIQQRATHLDALADKLREPRVRAIIQPLLAGADIQDNLPIDDIDYVVDLGLIERFPNGRIDIANALYREVIPRTLIYVAQSMMAPPEAPWYCHPDGALDLPKLIREFQQFFREHADAWLEKYDYKEAGPQLLLQAYLQRVVNGGGRITREYGLGRRRTDLYVEWRYGDPLQVQRFVLELKITHKGKAKALAEGLPQTADYADRCGAAEAHLLLFDRGPTAWDDKIYEELHQHAGREIGVWGM